MIDDIESPSSIVLEYLDDNLLDVSIRKRVEGADVKFVARTVLEALSLLHEKGYVHTGQSHKPRFTHTGIQLAILILIYFGPHQMLNPTTFLSTMVTTKPASAESRWEIVAMSIDLM